VPGRLPLVLLALSLYALPAAAQEAAPSSTRKLAADRTERARTLAARGDTAQALSAYVEALRLDDSYGPAWLGFGELRELFGDSKQAELAYTRALDFSDTRARAFEARSRLFDRTGRADDALADLAAACELEATPARLRELGRRFAARRAWPAALATARRLLTLLDPSSSEARAAGIEVQALSRLAAETDPVRLGSSGRGWIRRALAHSSSRRR
jgi:tetratricopeptide (TPR) repeat protein